jgi:hypothetical protein
MAADSDFDELVPLVTKVEQQNRRTEEYPNV